MTSSADYFARAVAKSATVLDTDPRDAFLENPKARLVRVLAGAALVRAGVCTGNSAARVLGGFAQQFAPSNLTKRGIGPQMVETVRLAILGDDDLPTPPRDRKEPARAARTEPKAPPKALPPSKAARQSPAGSRWTDELIFAARQLYQVGGCSAQITANKLRSGITRDMVASLAARQGWARAGSDRANGVNQPTGSIEDRLLRAPPVKKDPYSHSRLNNKPFLAALVTPVEPVGGDDAAPLATPVKYSDMASALPLGATRVAFSRLGHRDCRWPIDHAAEPGHAAMTCCGAPVVEGRFYCASHVLRATSERPLTKLRAYDPTIVKVRGRAA